MLKKLEEYVFHFLVIILALYIVVEVIELVYDFGRILFAGNEGDGRLFFSREEIQEILPVFFSILIAVELIETFNMYVKQHSIKVLNILLIGIIAVGRKLITVDFAHTDALSNIGLGVLIISLALGYYFIKKTETDKGKEA